VLLASAFSVVYPCHVPQQVMRTKPVGTGPFKFVEFKRGESIRLVRNPDYFKRDRPYLDEIAVRTIDSRATRMLAFSTGEFDITFPSDVSVPLLKDIKERAPKAVCEMTTTGVLINLLVNRVNPPFDNPDIRKAMSLALDRKPFNTILMEGTGRFGGAMLPKPEGEWGMPEEMVKSLAGYGSDAEKNLAEAQAIMQKLGYSEAKPLRHQSADLSRSRGHRHRSAQEDLCRRRARHSRHPALVHKARPQGIHHRAQCHRRQRRRSRWQYGGELLLQFRAQLHAILQCRG
jgi:peptide/nickel transport system substrate-binding protein